MTEKNIFGNFFVVKYFRFLFTFYVKTATSPEKSHPLFPSNLPLKIGILSSPLYWTFDQSLNTPSRKGGAGGVGGDYYFGRYSSELAQLVSHPYSWGRSIHYSNSLHDFSVIIPRCYKDVYVSSFFPCAARL